MLNHLCVSTISNDTHDSATLEKHLVKITKAAVDSKIHKLSLATRVGKKVPFSHLVRRQRKSPVLSG